MEFIKQKAPLVARIFLGLVFTVFGLNGFLQFLPMPEMPEAAGSFLGALAATGYLFPLIKGTEVTAGLLLLSNRFVPLALTLLAPITINILLFHAVLAPALGLPLLIITAQIFLAYAYRNNFAPLLQSRSSPSIGSSHKRASEGEPVGAH